MNEIIDSHAHIYPHKIAEKATKNVGLFYDIEMDVQAGTVDRLIEESKRAGISRSVVSSVATTRHQVGSVNGYIIDMVQKYPSLIGYMTLHPDMEQGEIEREIAYCVDSGLRGIKLHPDFQKFNIDSPEARRIYRVAEGVMPILFHTGDTRYEYSQPGQLARIAKEFPRLTCIGAHFGGYGVWYDIDCYKGIKNIYFDTSSSLMFLPPRRQWSSSIITERSGSFSAPIFRCGIRRRSFNVLCPYRLRTLSARRYFPTTTKRVFNLCY
jgi:Predicted metal-dependent hydrolase of the TIM-barrel fold